MRTPPPFLGELAEELPDGLIVTDRTSRIVYLNRCAETILGYTRTELLDRPIDVVVPLRGAEGPPRLIPDDATPLDRVGNTLPWNMVRKDGTGLEVVASVSQASWGGHTYHLASIRAPLPTSALESSQIRVALRRSPVMLGTVDRDLRYQWLYNPEPHFPLERALGKRDDELNAGRGIDELVALKQRVLDTAEPAESTIEFDLGDEVRTYDVFATPLFGDNGEVVAVTSVSVDVSHLRQLMRVQREFVAKIAHDLRQPATIVLGQAQLMLKRKAFDAAALTDIETQGRRLSEMIEDLLDTSALESGTLRIRTEPCDLAEIVRRVASHASAQTSQHEFEVDVAENVRGMWDRARIEQVLENLVTNAVKYSPNGGMISLAIDAGADEVRVSVSDEGKGLVPEDLSVIFECFGRSASTRQTRIAGLGLGLCIAKGLVEAHGGRLSATSDGPWRGSAFAFTLPYRLPAVPAHLVDRQTA